MMYHIPVLLEESIEGLNIREDGIYVDATFGGGGHTAEILKRLGEKGRLVAFDRDPEAVKNKPEDERVIMINQDYRYMRNFLKLFRMAPVHGILADLGVSSHQIDDPQRGFSFRYDARLDLRMNPAGKLTAARVVNEYSAHELAGIFREYGELNRPARIAKAINEKRTAKSIETTGELRDALTHLAPKGQENKFLAKVFQALRIAVNDELGSLRELLTQAGQLLTAGGRLAVISYHSLEDRMVKNFMKTGNPEGILHKDFFGNPERPFRMITPKPVTPSEKELNRNKRSRSARLRIAEKTED